MFGISSRGLVLLRSTIKRYASWLRLLRETTPPPRGWKKPLEFGLDQKEKEAEEEESLENVKEDSITIRFTISGFCPFRIV